MRFKWHLNENQKRIIHFMTPPLNCSLFNSLPNERGMENGEFLACRK